MKDLTNYIKRSILAGLFIGLAGFVYLSTPNNIVGAFLFAFGLSCVVLYKLNLFTGKAGVTKSKEYHLLLMMFLLNAIGCFLAAIIASFKIDNIRESLNAIIEARQHSSLLSIFVLAIGTGIIMEAAVMHSARSEHKNWLPLILGVPTFILCGMPHSVADSFYYSLHCLTNYDGLWFLTPLLLTVLGNFIGCNLLNIFRYRL